MDKRLLSDWIAIIAIDIGAIGTAVWKYRIGDTSPRLGLISGISAVVALNVIYLFGVRVRNRRLGVSTQGSLLLRGVVCGLLSCSVIWLMLRNEMSANDIMVTALSSKPISEIRPEEKALVVQFFRREIERDREYKQRVLQRKSPEFPLFSNESFANPTIMQREVDWLNDAVTLDTSMYDQHERNLGEFQSIMSKRHPSFLQPFNVAIRGKEESTAELVSLEKQLLDTTIDLYRFAERNPENISYQHGNLVSHDAAVWETFAEKRKCCMGIYQRLRPLVPRWLSA